jgi:hypothetical protein
MGRAMFAEAGEAEPVAATVRCNGGGRLRLVIASVASSVRRRTLVGGKRGPSR